MQLHSVVDERGRLVAYRIAPGQRGDAPVAGSLIDRLPITATFLADRAYGSEALRLARGPRTTPAIPNAP